MKQPNQKNENQSHSDAGYFGQHLADCAYRTLPNHDMGQPC